MPLHNNQQQEANQKQEKSSVSSHEKVYSRPSHDLNQAYRFSFLLEPTGTVLFLYDEDTADDGRIAVQ